MLQVIKNFKAGKYNVLVSTSIGEEGLDIGEIDMIVCYDAQKTPIRMVSMHFKYRCRKPIKMVVQLQRVGRTGRKRDGYVHVLLAEGREERNWERAEQQYREIQHFIVRAEQLELYGDVERLIPEHIKPECVEMTMEIEEHVREDPNSRKRSFDEEDDGPSSKRKRRKRDDNPTRNVPTGASTGFVNVKDLLVKGGATAKKRKPPKEFDILAGEDDDDDLEIEAGLFGPRRTASASTASSKPASRLKKPKRANTIADPDGKKKTKPVKAATGKKKEKISVEPTASQFERMAAEDSDNAEIEHGLSLSDEPLSSRRRTTPRTPSPAPRPHSPSQWASSPAVPLADHSIIDLTTPDPSHPPRMLTLLLSPDRPPKPSHVRPRSVSPDEDIPVSVQRSSEPPAESPSVTSRSVSADAPAAPDLDMSWLIEDDEDDFDLKVVASSPLLPRGSLPPETGASSEVEFVEEPQVTDSPPRNKVLDSSPLSRQTTKSVANDMPPPALPARFAPPVSPSSDDLAPEPSFAVRAPGKLPRKRPVVVGDSSPLAMPPASQRRLQRQHSPSPDPESDPEQQSRPPKRKKRKFRDFAEAQKMNPWMDVEATHSGDERSIGSSDVDQPENEYDRRFVSDFPETQVSPSYDQSAVYRRSLLTQAPGTAPIFANRPVRRGASGFALSSPSKPRHIASSSPRYADDDDDGYVFGSFVVEDDADVSFANSSSEL